MCDRANERWNPQVLKLLHDIAKGTQLTNTQDHRIIALIILILQINMTLQH